MNPLARPAARWTYRIAGALLLPLLSWQLLTRVWVFPDPAPFRGSSLYNPYRDVPFATGLARANFHAHTRSWGGATDGRRIAAGDLRKGYAGLGYDVAQISDYMTIRPAGEGAGAWIPTYEHGYGLTKTHQLCLGAPGVDWLDFPLFQTVHHKQTVIDRLRKSAKAVAVVHPEHWGGYSLDDFRALSGYQLVEVVSAFPGDAIQFWDAALSTGHPVFAVANDDSHGLEGSPGAGACATYVAAPASDGHAIVEALLAGRAYAARVDPEAGETLAAKAARFLDLPRLSGFSVDGETVRVALSGPARSIRFVGQGGRELGRTLDAAEASYLVAPGDRYVRAEVDFAGKTRLYLNPVFRYSGTDPLRMREPRERPLASGLLRAAAVLPWIALAWLAAAARRRR